MYGSIRLFAIGHDAGPKRLYHVKRTTSTGETERLKHSLEGPNNIMGVPMNPLLVFPETSSIEQPSSRKMEAKKL